MRNLLLIAISIMFFVSCNPLIKLVFHVKDIKKIPTRSEAEILNRKIIDKFDINYIMLYRTNYYLHQTADTLIWRDEVKYFSSNRLLYVQHTNFCPSASYRDINPDSLILTGIESNDSAVFIDKYLVGLEYPDGSTFNIDSISLKKYNVVMDFNSWWIGPEKRRLRKINKALPEDSTFYLFINKDYIISDSLELYKFFKNI